MEMATMNFNKNMHNSIFRIRSSPRYIQILYYSIYVLVKLFLKSSSYFIMILNNNTWINQCCDVWASIVKLQWVFMPYRYYESESHGFKSPSEPRIYRCVIRYSIWYRWEVITNQNEYINEFTHCHLFSLIHWHIR